MDKTTEIEKAALERIAGNEADVNRETADGIAICGKLERSVALLSKGGDK